MVTVTINIKPYLAGYMYVRYRQSLEPDPENQSHSSSPSKQLIPIHLSHITPVYHFLHQLSVPHPQNTSWKEIGNICFVLPKPRNGKNPEVYNYIGNDSALIIEKEIETEMKAELYSFLLDNKFALIFYKETRHTILINWKKEGTFLSLLILIFFANGLR